MIETISPEQGRLKDAATVAAAAHLRHTFPVVPSVSPKPDLIKSIGRFTDADAFRGSSPDLQSLLDSLLANFGTEHDLVRAETRDREKDSKIRENNDGSREAVKSLRATANEGEQTVELEHKVRQQEADSEPLLGATENRLGAAEARIDEVDFLSERAHTAGEEAREDSGSLKRSADLFEQKAAAAESAARLYRVMAEKVRRKAVAQVEKEREQKRQQEALNSMTGDADFAERLREMNRILQG